MPSIFHLPRDERASSLCRESYPVQVYRLAVVSLAFAYGRHLIVAPATANWKAVGAALQTMGSRAGF